MPDEKIDILRSLSDGAGEGAAVDVEGVTVCHHAGSAAFEGCNPGVSGQGPGAAVIKAYIDRTDFGGDGFALGIRDLAADTSGKGASVCQIQAQCGVAAHQKGAAEFLRIGVERRDVAGAAPAVVTYRKKHIVR